MEVKPGYKKTDVGVIPDNWDVLPFKEVFNISAGGDVSPKLSSTERDQTHCYPIYSNAVTDRGFYGYCSYANHPARSITITARGTLGVANYRNHKYTAIGRVLVLEPKREAAGEYFAEFINSRIKFAIESTGVPQLTAPQIGGYRLAVPPLPEQRAIAKALSDVDGLLATLDRLIAKKCDLKQAAMQRLLTGRTRLPGFHGKWEVKRLGECLTASPRYGINAPAVKYSDRLPTYIRITDISDDGRFSLEKRVSVSSPYSDQYLLEVGDLVFARTGASVGKSYLYRASDGPLVFAGFLIRIKPDQAQLKPAYLSALVAMPAYWDWVRLMSTRTGQPGINGKEYKELPLLLPDPNEQGAIAAVLSDMDAELVALEARRDKTRALKQGMMQELLTGKTRLVSQGGAHA